MDGPSHAPRTHSCPTAVDLQRQPRPYGTSVRFRRLRPGKPRSRSGSRSRVAAVTSTGWQSLLQRAFDEYYDGLWKAVAGLSDEERRFRATDETNHIDFLVWHMARNEDGTISACAREQELWAESDWPRAWRLPVDADGCGFSAAEVADFPMVDIGEVETYFRDVRARTNAFLGALMESSLGDLVWDHNPDVTIGQILGHLVVEQSQHLGQIALIRGLQRGTEFTTSWNTPQTPTPS